MSSNARQGPWGSDWHYRPEMYMQYRPPHAEPLINGVDFSLQHERAHWLQFAGSTIGSLLMTLTRAEECAYLDGRDDIAQDRVALEAWQNLAASGQPLISLDSQGHADTRALGRLPDRLRQLAQTIITARQARTLLLDADRQWTWQTQSRAAVIRNGHELAGYVYGLHTGHTRLWTEEPILDPLRPISEADIGPCLGRGGRELTTRHILEGAARFDEWLILCGRAWLPDGSFGGLTAESMLSLNDSLKYSNSRYTDCALMAVDMWATSVDEPATETLARNYYTLAACFDIALNPPCAPIARQPNMSWSQLYPPLRFKAAVETAKRLGVLGSLKNAESESAYKAHRADLLAGSSLSYGELDHRSFQLPAISGELFADEGWAQQAPNISSFDYYIWAAEAVHAYRRDSPLHWVTPQLQQRATADRPLRVDQMGDAESMAMHAPLYALGSELGWHAFMSESFAHHLYQQLLFGHAIRQLSHARGTIDVSPVTLGGYRGDSRTEVEIQRALVEVTQVPEYTSWPVDTGTARQPNSEAEEPSRIDPRVERVHQRVASRPRKVLQIRRDEVERRDPGSVVAVVRELGSAEVDNQGSLDLYFSGYQHDPRELYRNDGVLLYMQAVADAVPTWAWWFRATPQPNDSPGFTLMFWAQCGDPTNITDREWETWFYKLTTPLIERAQVLKVEDADIQAMVTGVSLAIAGVLTHRPN